jgi:RNA-splicing ligase RtcB
MPRRYIGSHWPTGTLVYLICHNIARKAIVDNRLAWVHRKGAIRRLDQATIDKELDACDILSNCRQYPKDGAPDAYKDFSEVPKSVELAGLATPVAKLTARFVIKDGGLADD